MDKVFSIDKLCSESSGEVPTAGVGKMSKADRLVVRGTTEYSIYYRAKVFKLLIVAMTALGISFLSPQQASAQTNSTSSPPGVGNIPNYPVGTRIYPNGVINTPNGSTIAPATTINNGNGTTTYYYQDGTRINTNSNTVSPGGSFLTPGSSNGGFPPTPQNPNRGILPAPGNSNRGLNNQ
ncbi:hypothetical protein SAMD00079811_05400 [Scytonema sp. HK-05]|uniref:hypothetical protein n=1 Tax=Scytonema sp. HK-05 TaxID=1137095 RepID=UPI0009368A18|nr:hypothetical protein [Scytonema sp. HK-05]OKH60091.1 hypothetical protein NIES2130_04830 [Scytonema sp. HK-05]BAY42962.1 hypothetical protein SAMD00079811_05400 [Scytonema sp. HK-05]